MGRTEVVDRELMLLFALIEQATIVQRLGMVRIDGDRLVELRQRLCGISGLSQRLGERLEMTVGEASLAGRFDGLAPDGALMLTLDDGTQRRVNAGEVAAARAA